MPREWLYSTLAANEPLLGVPASQIFQSTSLTEVPYVKPFITYRFGLASTALVGDDFVNMVSQPLQIFIHDIPGDYARIDTIIGSLKAILEAQSSDLIVRCSWLEISEDLRDDEMMTIFRYARLQLTLPIRITYV